MTNDQQLDHLIGVLYDTAIDSTRWQEAFRLCVHYASGVDGQMVTIDKRKSAPVAEVTAFDQQSGEAYVNYYRTIDPRQPMILGEAAQWQNCRQFFDQDYVNHSEFFQDFLIPANMRYSIVTRLDHSEDQFTTVGILRAVNQRPFDDRHILAARCFTGHLQRALRLQIHTQHLQAKAELGALAIDALSLAMLIVDDKGAILHLNAGAENLLNNRVSGLASKQGALLASDPFNKNKLSALITDATACPAVGGAMFLNGEQTRQVFVTPLSASSPFSRDWQKPLALILVVEPSTSLSPLQLLGKLYDFTPAELRVASALLAGKTPEECAQEAQVSINTVRSQLRSLFNKTNVRGQTELMAVLTRTPPLA